MSWLVDFDELYSEDFDETYLSHFGVGWDNNPPGVGSGRYEHGSGDRPYQHSYDIYSRVQKLKKSGLSETEIAEAMGYKSTSELRAKYQVAKNDVREYKRQQILELEGTIDPDTGKLYSRDKIAKLVGLKNESVVRSYLTNEQAVSNSVKTQRCVDDLKNLVGDGNYINVTKGAELGLGVSQDRLKVALDQLKEEGYYVGVIKIPQVGAENGQMTTLKVLCPPGTTNKELWNNRYEIQPVEKQEGDQSYSLLGIMDPTRVSLDRIDIKYAEDGGTDKDGVIEIRAVRDENGNLVAASPDLSLGNAKYAQVRIAVDGDNYIKGMAVYNENLPEGTDILVNSNKSVKGGVEGALKKMNRLKDKDGNDLGVDTDNPFGATVFQTKLPDGKLSAINVVSDIYGVDKHQEGAWDEWSRNLPAQFLAKQSDALIKQQLKLKTLDMEKEYDEIISLNNPVIKQKMLEEFANKCDAAAVDLKAAPLPGQRVQVLLPVPSLKESETYAPNYENGTTLALIRFPHTGPFEIPIVKVNNHNKEANSFMKDAADAIGVNPKTASVLSGADFDGDTVTVIPMTRRNSQGEFEKVVNIKGLGNGQAELPGLKGFSPTDAYPGTDDQGNTLPGVKLMDKRTKGIEMGVVSNLITDMSLKGCEDPDELARAVKYSMVVIDAEKHKLNYKQAEKDYNIQELKDKYQGGHGVATLLSRAKSEVNYIPERKKLVTKINPETGEKEYIETHRTYEERAKVKAKDPVTGKLLKDENGKQIYERDENGRIKYAPTGKIKEAHSKSTRMAEAKDARELLSDHPSNKELLYSDFANKMKAMANRSRKEYLSVKNSELSDYKKDPEAAKKYAKEVSSLRAKLLKAEKNAPREQQAQLIANQIVSARKYDNPDMDKETLKKVKGQALNGARARTNAHKSRVTFSPEEWEAVNAHAISKTEFKKLLNNADSEHVKQMATPKKSRVSEATANHISALLNAGWSRTEIVEAGIASADTVLKVQNHSY